MPTGEKGDGTFPHSILSYVLQKPSKSTHTHTFYEATYTNTLDPSALPGLSGGGAAAPISQSAEQYGVNEPHSASADSLGSKKRSEPHHASPSPSHRVEQKFTKLDKDEVDIASAGTQEGEQRAREKRVQDAVGADKASGNSGGHADVEMMHGRATLEGDKSREGKNGTAGAGADAGSSHDIAHDADMLQRKKAEKFGGVNLDNDETGHEHGNNNGSKGSSGQSNGGHGDGEKKKSAQSTGTSGHAGAAAHADGKMDYSKENEGSKASSGLQNGGHAAGETKGKSNGDHATGEKNNTDHGAGGLANDADLLQRKKAEKFGGVNLGDD
jgi:hypothetical protein